MSKRQSLASAPSVVALLAAASVSCSDKSTGPQTPVPSAINLSVEQVGFSWLGESHKVTASVKSQTGAAINVAVNWSVDDPRVAAVSSTGVITAESNGTTRVRATAGSIEGTVNVSVAQQPSVLAISGSIVNLPSVGAAHRVSATVRDAGGREIVAYQVRWTSSNNAVATVSNDGLVTGTGFGTAIITAHAGTLTAEVTVTVTGPPPVASIAITPPRAVLVEGATLSLAVELRDAAGTPLGARTLVWESDAEAVARVSSSGVVTAVATGQAMIRAVSEGVTATMVIVVLSPPGAAMHRALSAAIDSPSDLLLARRALETVAELFAEMIPDRAIHAYVLARNAALQGSTIEQLNELARTIASLPSEPASLTGRINPQPSSVGSRQPTSLMSALRTSPGDGDVKVLYLNGVRTSPTDAQGALQAIRSLASNSGPLGSYGIHLGWSFPRYTFDLLSNPTAPFLSEFFDYGESAVNILGILTRQSITPIANANAVLINDVIERERRSALVVAHSQGNLIILEALAQIRRPECLGIVSLATPTYAGWPDRERTPSAGITGAYRDAYDIILLLSALSGIPPQGHVVLATEQSYAFGSQFDQLGTNERDTVKYLLHEVLGHYLRDRIATPWILNALREVDRELKRTCGRITARRVDTAGTVPIAEASLVVGEEMQILFAHESPTTAVGLRPIDSVAPGRYTGDPVFEISRSLRAGSAWIRGLTAGKRMLVVRSGPVVLELPISVNVPEDHLAVTISPDTVRFVAEAEGDNPSPVTASVISASSTGEELAVVLGTPSVAGGARGWLTASIDQAHTPAQITVRSVVAGLSIGLHRGTIPLIVTSRWGSDTLQIPVTMTVAPARPTIGASPSQVVFEARERGPSPAPVQVSIQNTGRGELADIRIATVRYATEAGWLRAQLASARAPTTLTLTAVVGNLSVGTHSATVVLESATATNSPRTVDVTLHVRALGPPQMAGSCTQTCPMRCPLGSVTAQMRNDGLTITERQVEVPRFYWPGYYLQSGVTLESRLHGRLDTSLPAHWNTYGTAITQFALSYYAPDGSMQSEARYHNEHFISGYLPFSFDAVSGGRTFQSYNYGAYLQGSAPNQTRSAILNATARFNYFNPNYGDVTANVTGDWTIIYHCALLPSS